MDTEQQRELYRELIELRQIASEKEALAKSNQEYLTQISDMEIQISELNAQLEAKDFKIESIQNISQGSIFGEESSAQMVYLEEENKYLRTFTVYKEQAIELQSKLDQALSLKQQYQAKYKEALVEIEKYKLSWDTALVDENKELSEKCEMLQDKLRAEQEKFEMLKSNLQIMNQLKAANIETKPPAASTERTDRMSTTPIQQHNYPKLVLTDLEKSGNTTERTHRMRVLSPRVVSVSRPLNTSHDTGNTRSQSISVAYCPSFQRNKKLHEQAMASQKGSTPRSSSRPNLFIKKQ